MKINIKNLTPNKGKQFVPIRRNTQIIKSKPRKLTQIIGFCIIIVLLLLLIINKTEANDPKYKTNICNTNKCKARVERLNECNGDIKCAVKLTQEASYNHLLKDITNLEKESSKGLKSYKKEQYKFTREGEGAFQSKAFCDSYYKTNKGLIRHPANLCKKWTIGFGTNSYNGEVISYEEAIKRKEQAIDVRDNSITTTCLSNNARVIAVDFIYQYSSKYANQMRKYANDCNEKAILDYIIAHRDFYSSKEQWGLVKREQKRINYFYNKG